MDDDRKLTISVGKFDGRRRKAALLKLATALGVVGLQGDPSIGQVICRIADAFEYDPQAVTDHLAEIMALAGAAYVMEAEETAA